MIITQHVCHPSCFYTAVIYDIHHDDGDCSGDCNIIFCFWMLMILSLLHFASASGASSTLPSCVVLLLVVVVVVVLVVVVLVVRILYY